MKIWFPWVKMPLKLVVFYFFIFCRVSHSAFSSFFRCCCRSTLLVEFCAFVLYIICKKHSGNKPREKLCTLHSNARHTWGLMIMSLWVHMWLDTCRHNSFGWGENGRWVYFGRKASATLATWHPFESVASYSRGRVPKERAKLQSD